MGEADVWQLNKDDDFFINPLKKGAVAITMKNRYGDSPLVYQRRKHKHP